MLLKLTNLPLKLTFFSVFLPIHYLLELSASLKHYEKSSPTELRNYHSHFSKERIVILFLRITMKKSLRTHFPPVAGHTGTSGKRFQKKHLPTENSFSYLQGTVSLSNIVMPDTTTLEENTKGFLPTTI